MRRHTGGSTPLRVTLNWYPRPLVFMSRLPDCLDNARPQPWRVLRVVLGLAQPLRPCRRLQAERSQLPELKRVIVASGTRIVMAQTLDEALAQLFGARPGPGVPAPVTPGPRPGGPPPGPAPAAPAGADVRALTEQAVETYRRAQERLRAGDLAGYGREMERLGQILEQLDSATKLPRP